MWQWEEAAETFRNVLVKPDETCALLWKTQEAVGGDASGPLTGPEGRVSSEATAENVPNEPGLAEVGEMGQCWFKGADFHQEIANFCRYNVHHGDYGEQYCITYLKVA